MSGRGMLRLCARTVTVKWVLAQSHRLGRGCLPQCEHQNAWPSAGARTLTRAASLVNGWRQRLTQTKQKQLYTLPVAMQSGEVPNREGGVNLRNGNGNGDGFTDFEPPDFEPPEPAS